MYCVRDESQSKGEGGVGGGMQGVRGKVVVELRTNPPYSHMHKPSLVLLLPVTPATKTALRGRREKSLYTLVYSSVT